MNNELIPCTHCGSEDIHPGCLIGLVESVCYCICDDCGTRGPDAPSQEQARAAWNKCQVSANVTVSANGERGDLNE